MDGDAVTATLASIAEPSETTPAAPFLRLAGLRRVFGAHVAVRALDLDVGAGEYLTLLGPSGCGKTTTLRMIAGFLAPSGGQIGIDGQDITHLPPERRPVNTVFQDYALFPHLSVRQNVEYGLRVRKVAGSERRARVDELLARVELTALADRYPRSLSGGQQQRVALARALVCRPRLLLLDEPLGALDARLRVTMQGLLKSLQRAFQIAFIHVTHDQGEALALSDRVAVMRDGAVAQVGTPATLYQRPANPFVADFLGTTNLLEGRCVRQDGEVITLAVGALAVRGITAARFASGDRACLSLRPTVITLHPSVTASDSSTHPLTHSPTHTLCSGEIVDATYRGEDWLLRVRCDGADFLVASAGGAAQVGQPVQLAWAAHAAWVMQP